MKNYTFFITAHLYGLIGDLSHAKRASFMHLAAEIIVVSTIQTWLFVISVHH